MGEVGGGLEDDGVAARIVDIDFAGAPRLVQRPLMDGRGGAGRNRQTSGDKRLEQSIDIVTKDDARRLAERLLLMRQVQVQFVCAPGEYSIERR